VVEKALKPFFIDAIAVTRGPGLMPCLLVGVETAKALSYAWQKPIIGINHLEGHIYSVEDGYREVSRFPSLALIVSGGHTELVLIKKLGHYQCIGQTRDDAVGECFDKVAKILGLGYPGGPAISKSARKGRKNKFLMPRPMIDSPGFDFSFSGLKTHILYLVREISKPHLRNLIPDITVDFEEAVADVLVSKTIKAALKYQVRSIIVAGGVSANQRLRQKIKKAAKKQNIPCFLPPLFLTGDNAVMIGAAACFRIRYKGFDSLFTLKAEPDLSL
jgi:N6-L-threonylcarbamoyladenine synthase